MKLKWEPAYTKKLYNALFAIVVVALLGVVVMLVIVYDPLQAYGELFKGMFVTKLNFGTTLEKVTPVLLTGLAFVTSMKVGFMNMGVEGQYLLGGIVSAWLGVALKDTMPPVLVTLVCIVGSMLAGLLWSLIPAIMKAYLHANEICTTILLNYVASLFTTYLCLYPLYGQEAVAQTAKIDKSILLPHIMRPSRANIGLFIAVGLVVFFAFFFRRTGLGFKIQAVGENPLYSSSLGISPKKYLIVAVMISGALAGLAGSIEVLGIHTRFVNGLSSNITLYGMLAALISGGGFIALPVYSFIIGALKAGALGMERFTGLSDALIDMLIAVFILFTTMKLAPKMKGFGSRRLKGGKDT